MFLLFSPFYVKKTQMHCDFVCTESKIRQKYLASCPKTHPFLLIIEYYVMLFKSSVREDKIGVFIINMSTESVG